MKDLWDDFWLKRNRPLTQKEETAFRNNFYAIYALILNYFGIYKRQYVPMSLEIGCGRATISDYLLKFGFDTWTMDRISRIENSHAFFYGDAWEKYWNIEYDFDLIVSYGLLEHFTYEDQCRIVNNCDKYLSSDGIQIHYVVPRKWTNIFEDRSVYRDDCLLLRNMHDPIWTYPALGKRWIANKWIGKGFIFSLGKQYEDTGPRYRKIIQH